MPCESFGLVSSSNAVCFSYRCRYLQNSVYTIYIAKSSIRFNGEMWTRERGRDKSRSHLGLSKLPKLLLPCGQLNGVLCQYIQSKQRAQTENELKLNETKKWNLCDKFVWMRMHGAAKIGQSSTLLLCQYSPRIRIFLLSIETRVHANFGAIVWHWWQPTYALIHSVWVLVCVCFSFRFAKFLVCGAPNVEHMRTCTE